MNLEPYLKQKQYQIILTISISRLLKHQTFWMKDSEAKTGVSCSAGQPAFPLFYQHFPKIDIIFVFSKEKKAYNFYGIERRYKCLGEIDIINLLNMYDYYVKW